MSVGDAVIGGARPEASSRRIEWMTQPFDAATLPQQRQWLSAKVTVLVTSFLDLLQQR